MKNLEDWLNSGEYLPHIMRDFHDQKDLFKTIHTLYSDSEPQYSAASVARPLELVVMRYLTL